MDPKQDKKRYLTTSGMNDTQNSALDPVVKET